MNIEDASGSGDNSQAPASMQPISFLPTKYLSENHDFVAWQMCGWQHVTKLVPWRHLPNMARDLGTLPTHS